MILLEKYMAFQPQVFRWPGKAEVTQIIRHYSKGRTLTNLGEKVKKYLWDIFKNQTSVNLYKKTLHHKKRWASGFSAMILLTVSFIFTAFCFHISGTGASNVPCFIVSYCASITKYMKAEWKALLNIFLCYKSMHSTQYYSLQDLNSYFWQMEF